MSSALCDFVCSGTKEYFAACPAYRINEIASSKSHINLCDIKKLNKIKVNRLVKGQSAFAVKNANQFFTYIIWDNRKGRNCHIGIILAQTHCFNDR